MKLCFRSCIIFWDTTIYAIIEIATIEDNNLLKSRGDGNTILNRHLPL
jgi:hypothetical protein